MGGKDVDATVAIDVSEDGLPWHSLPDEAAVLKQLDTSRDGLTDAEATARLAKWGPNALTPPPKRTFLQRLWAQVNT